VNQIDMSPDTRQSFGEN